MILKSNVKKYSDVDVVVAGGSATGVNAAVAASRLGMKVCIIEGSGFFGGTATAGLVTIWHSIKAMDNKTKIIRGITGEILYELNKRKALRTRPDWFRHDGEFVFETEDMKLVLDDLIVKSNADYLLHTFVTDVIVKNDSITGVIIENKSGRRFIGAKMFVDATGDADLAHFSGCPYEKNKEHQPPTMCVKIANWPKEVSIAVIPGILSKPKYRKVFPKGFLWGSNSVQKPGEVMIAGTRVFGSDSTDGKSLSMAEVEGRRQVKVMVDALRTEAKTLKNISIAALPSYIGLRESRKIIGKFRLTSADLLSGRKFEDAIGNGTYPADVHHGDGEGITFMYLNGVKRSAYFSKPSVISRWTENKNTANYYQLPFRIMLPQKIRNLVVAGRPVSVDKTAYGATRVMVNCNQTGHAAGVAAALCVKKRTIPSKLDHKLLRHNLKKQGAIIL